MHRLAFGPLGVVGPPPVGALAAVGGDVLEDHRRRLPGDGSAPFESLARSALRDLRVQALHGRARREHPGLLGLPRLAQLGLRSLRGALTLAGHAPIPPFTAPMPRCTPLIPRSGSPCPRFSASTRRDSRSSRENSG